MPVALSCLCLSPTAFAETSTGKGDASSGVVEAVTAAGDKVRLFPTGKWEYVDPKKAEEARPQVQAYEEKQAKAQGGIFGVGRKIQEGDKDYNRGSLNPKMR
jgi:hypothetical protein